MKLHIWQHSESVTALAWLGLFFHLLLVAQLQTPANAFFNLLWDATVMASIF